MAATIQRETHLERRRPIAESVRGCPDWVVWLRKKGEEDKGTLSATALFEFQLIVTQKIGIPYSSEKAARVKTKTPCHSKKNKIVRIEGTHWMPPVRS